MDIIADTNIFLCVALNEREKEGIVQLTSDATVVAPEILPYEIGNALSAMVRRRRLSAREAHEAEKLADSIPVRLVSVDIQASLQIAFDNNIYAYDAYFLQCARELANPILTLDRQMKRVAELLGIKVLEFNQ